MKGFGCGMVLAAITMASACSNGGNNGPSAIPVIPGTAQIRIKGGMGTNDAGGKGNILDINNYTGGDVRILRNGAVDASFAVPAVAPYLGSNPLTISGNMTLTPLPLGSSLATLPGDDGFHPATGLVILPGATLTLNPNDDDDNADGDADDATGTRESVHLYLPDGLSIQGTLRVGRRDAVNPGDGLSPSAADLNLFVLGNIVVATSGGIDLRGTNAINAGNGGQLYLNQVGLVVCQGTLDASGGSGITGGVGGTIAITTIDALYVTGTLRTNGGGGGTANPGGKAGDITLYGTMGTYVAGTLSAVGGNGPLNGGAGGIVAIVNASVGPVVSSADVRATGGNGTALFAHGGTGGELVVGTWSGFLRIAGRLETRGGAGPNGIVGKGGMGGAIQIWNQVRSDASGEANSIGATLDTCGGDGLMGGDAGVIRIDINNASADHNPSEPGMHLLLVGYERIESSGGDGTTGSHAGDPAASDHAAITVSNYYGFDGQAYATGSIVNETPLVARGGSGSAGGGGSGGLVVLWSDTTYPDREDRSVTSSGAIDVRGGDGTTTGGTGGLVRIRDRYRTTNTAAIDASGGAGGSGAGGTGGAIGLSSTAGELYNEGALTADGGASASGDGGSARWATGFSDAAVSFFGGTVTTYGALSATGGDSGSAAGGYGGSLLISSLDAGAVSTVGSPRDVSGGAGSPAGEVGTVYIDGIQVAP
jgi:hypothetical protein